MGLEGIYGGEIGELEMAGYNHKINFMDEILYIIINHKIDILTETYYLLFNNFRLAK